VQGCVGRTQGCKNNLQAIINLLCHAFPTALNACLQTPDEVQCVVNAAVYAYLTYNNLPAHPQWPPQQPHVANTLGQVLY